ncbi:hypothetical protein ACERK3_00600 [Phycisphaerales bacterium AB-hyl4]|uniref:Outer membrane beta-barrel porin/alpha-amylase n=1 Tax=Natronomicrosphaera hydrolytica TaxID=3242702 RepID=A0ABV4TZL8_9BACT
MRNVLAAMAVCLSTMLTTQAVAQTGAPLLIEPWPEDVYAQHRPEVQLWRTHTKGQADEDVDFVSFRDRARYRLDPTDPRSPSVGYDVYGLNLSTDDPALPPRLVDVSVGTGLLLHEDEQWTISMPLAVGFAGTRPFNDGRAWYGKASILAFQRLDERSQLMFALEYNGNRAILPDVPIPGFAYIRQMSDTLRMTLGAPVSGVDWRPDDHWHLRFNYYVFAFDLDVRYHITREWAMFASFNQHQRAFHQHGDDRHRRLFFRQRHAELGTRWQVADRIELIAAGGYTFGSRLQRGYDIRDTDTIRHFSDTPYVRLGLSASF